MKRRMRWNWQYVGLIALALLTLVVIIIAFQMPHGEVPNRWRQTAPYTVLHGEIT